jgi:ubiquinone/menaquinone biosynthesis C-methylase UbiE
MVEIGSDAISSVKIFDDASRDRTCTKANFFVTFINRKTRPSCYIPGLNNMTDTLTKLTYQTLQQGKNYFSFAHKTLVVQLQKIVAPNIRAAAILPMEIIPIIQTKLARLRAADLADAEAGVYPTSLLFDDPWADYLRYYPLMCWDMSKIWERIDRKQYQNFSPTVDTEGYPNYYVQNFHHQTDGYLSEESANLYDLQVEILFGGSADSMRRRVLAPLKAGLQQAFSTVPAKQQRVLDIACGTGRTLRAMRAALPQAALYGTDLSPAYLRKANELLSQIPGELPQLLQANAEELPYLDNYFHAITCVFLFHELPGTVRQNVIDRAFHALQPGGTFVICDSIQLSDSPELAPAMEGFDEIFHEPYYADYTRDDLSLRLTNAGFSDVRTEVHFMSKYLIATKAK